MSAFFFVEAFHEQGLSWTIGYVRCRGVVGIKAGFGRGTGANGGHGGREERGPQGEEREREYKCMDGAKIYTGDSYFIFGRDVCISQPSHVSLDAESS